MATASDTLGIIDALTLWLASGASIDVNATPRQIWSHQAMDADSAPLHSIVRGYMGGTGNVIPTQNVQVMTIGPELRGAMGRAQSLHDVLIDPDDLQPKREFNVGGQTVAGVEVPTFRVAGLLVPEPPQHIETRDAGRVVVVFKFTAVYHRKP